MTSGERAFKIAFTLIMGLPFMIVGSPIIMSLLLGHLINFILNSQIPVMMRYVVSDPGLKRQDLEKAIKKLEHTAANFGIKEILFYGSFCRHQMKSTSDLDLRFQHMPGAVWSLKAYFYAFYMRLWSNLNGVPLDVYCFSDSQFLEKMRTDEHPALLFYSVEMTNRFKDAEGAWDALANNKNIV